MFFGNQNTNLGEVEDGSEADKHLIAKYGRELFDEYMNILSIPESFANRAPCFTANHVQKKRTSSASSCVTLIE